MALGFWKQRALSSDFFSENAADGFKSLKKDAPTDGDERPSSGDSGISECPLLGKCSSSMTHTKSENDSQHIVKIEPEEAVDLSSEGNCHEDRCLTESVRVGIGGQNKENTKPRQRQTAVQKKNPGKKSTTRESARNQEPQKKAIKLETTSQVELITSHSSGTESLRTRRIEANARERSRVHTIGAAFEALRQTVPSNCDQQKLSKLAILRMAAAYIRALKSLLDENSNEFAVGVEQCTQALLLDGVRSKCPKSIS